MSFKKLELKDIETAVKYLRFVKTKICDYSAGTFFMWGFAFGVETDYYGGALLSRYKDEKDGRYKYMLPAADGKEKIKNAIKFLGDNYCDKDGKIVFSYIPEEYIDLFTEFKETVSVFKYEKGFDYIYRSESLRTLGGRKYSGQRNQISQFKRNAESWEFKNINEVNIDDVKDFYKKIENDFRYSQSAVWESDMTKLVLDNFDLFGLFGGVLLVNGRIAGFSLGEKLNDTLYIHIEKADRSIKGAYQMIVHEFSAMFADSVTYINREDDADDEGLRTSKESYHPVSYLYKYGIIMNF